MVQKEEEFAEQPSWHLNKPLYNLSILHPTLISPEIILVLEFHLPPRLVAVLLFAPSSSFPSVGRLTNEEIHQNVAEKGWAKTRSYFLSFTQKSLWHQGGQTWGVRSREMSQNDGYLPWGRALLWSATASMFLFFIFLTWISVTGDCGDDGCLCNIKISCKENSETESKSQVYPKHSWKLTRI